MLIKIILKFMKKNSVIVNTSRGPIINEQDLINALNNDKISGAALDVYDQEPLPKDHILRKTKNQFLLHILVMSHLKHMKNFLMDYLIAIEAFYNKKPIVKFLKIIANYLKPIEVFLIVYKSFINL